MGTSDGTEKPEASQIKATKTEDVKSEEQQKVEGSRTPSGQNDSTFKDEEHATENPSLPEKAIQEKESSEGMKTRGSEDLKKARAQEVNQEESGTKSTRPGDNEKAADEKLKKPSDASRDVGNMEEKEEEKEKVNSEKVISENAKEVAENVISDDSKKENVMTTTKPEASIEGKERENDVNEANGIGGQSPKDTEGDDFNRKQKGQKGEHSETNNSTDDNDAMDIDSEPTNIRSGRTAPRTSAAEDVPTEVNEEKEDAAGSAGDISSGDAMEVDSKSNAENMKSDEEDRKSHETERVKEETKQTSGEEALTEASVDDNAPSGKQASTQNPAENSREPQQTEKKALRNVSRETTTAVETAKGAESGQGETKLHLEDKQVIEETKLSKDAADKKESTSGRSRRSSIRNTYQPRTLRPRTSGRVNSAEAPEAPTTQEVIPQKPRLVSGSSETKQTPASDPVPEKQGVVDEENTPRPTMEANGLVMRIDEAVFVTEDQLDELRVARLTDKKVKPFEHLTFQDLRTYNRDQLRAYCFAYGMARRKKTEMEADMARYLSYWNQGREGFALHEYVPTSSRVIDRVEPNPADSITAGRAGLAAQAGHVSREGSATPTTSNGKASASVKPPSSRGATPSRGGGPVVNSARMSGSQVSSALSSAGPAGAPTSTGISQALGSTQAGTQRNPATTSRAAKPASLAPILPRGFGTSFKQRVHARQAGAKFKAAYNGAGPAIVNIVENAAAYFEGKDSPEVILDQAKSYERYQFNVDMLNEIFDGVPDETDGDEEMTGTEANEDAKITPTNATTANAATSLFKRNVLENIASRVASGKRKALTAELNELAKQFKEMEEATKFTERTNMRLFQRLERAETKEQIQSVKQEFEAIHNIRFDESNPPPLVRRKLDKTLPPLVMSDEKCRILRFKVS